MKKDICQNTVFVDCFDTLIFRDVKASKVFRLWAEKLSIKYGISASKIYKTYTRTNVIMCIKKIFKSFTLQENFKVVISRFYNCLLKKFPELPETFIDDAINFYVATELEHFTVNDDMVNFLKEEKKSGKSIYLVSDFYCKTDIFKKWFESLGIFNLFDKLFSSSDFNKEKATSKIYKHLLKELNLKPETITMYGDNVWSDIIVARLCGLKAKRIRKKR